MYRLMIQDDGAYGDQGFKLPALRVLRSTFEDIWVSGDYRAKEALEGTGLVDHFVVKPKDFGTWDIAEKRRFLLDAVGNLEFHHNLQTHSCIPGRLCFHKGADPNADRPLEWKREINKDKNYFDEMSLHLQIPEAVGVRPATLISSREQQWLAEFRADYGIPDDAFLLGWQFTGSTIPKWYPFFDKVIQHSIMANHPEVYVVGLGDLKAKFRWPKEKHGGRFINLYDLVSFREAYLLTSIMDCFVTPNTGVFIFSQCFPRTPKILLSTLVAGYHCCCGDETTVIQSEAACSPCYNIILDCEHDGDNPWLKCMGKIAPSRVITAIERTIEAWQKL